MKTTKSIAIMLITFLSLASPAFAETAVRQDDSSILVWAFLGACALIIFLQLVPVISMTFGLIKGATGGKKVEAELEPVSSKYR
ncbi:MAG TPA: hypothetical protein VIR78_01205 [Malonomonas sp.]